MEPMEYLILLVFAAIIAILYTKGNQYVLKTSIGQKFYGTGTFFRATAVTTVVLFFAIIVAGYVLAVVGERPRLAQ